MLHPNRSRAQVSNSTTAQLGTSATAFDADSLDVSAVQQATTTTTASGQAAGSKAAIGAALALAIVNDQVIATTNRDVDATGAVTFEAMGASFSTLTSTASASGGEAADDSGKSSDGTVDDKVNTQLGDAQSKEKDSGVGDTEQQGKAKADATDDKGHSAATNEGKVSVAAAVAVNVQTAGVSASIPDNIAISAGEGGERKVVLTYAEGPWPGIYTFAAGRLKEVDAVPEPEKPKKPAPKKKKPAKRAKSASSAERVYVQ